MREQELLCWEVVVTQWQAPDQVELTEAMWPQLLEGIRARDGMNKRLISIPKRMRIIQVQG